MLDTLIRSGYVIDGTGEPGIKADVGIENGRIADLYTGEAPQAKTVIDAEGLIVAPGFIDIHTHSDRSLPKHPRGLSSVTQGITTVVGGNCGGSAAPLNDDLAKKHSQRGDFEPPWRTVEEYFEVLGDKQLGINLALLVGQGNVRGIVMGTEEREPTPAEMGKMQAILTEALDQGCVGISSGRRYMPGALASDEEVYELCEAASDYGCLYTSHIKNQDLGIIESIEELLELGRRTGLPLQLAHMKACGKPNWGRSEQLLQLLEEARQEGLDIMADVYPYTYTSMGSIENNMPDWLVESGREVALERLEDPKTVRKVVAELRHWARNNPVRARSTEQTGIVYAGEREDLVGLSIAEAAELLGVPDHATAVVELARQTEFELLTAGIMSEEDVRTIMSHPYSMIGSDGVSIDEAEGPVGSVHPRSFGTFSRVLGFYTRELGLLHLSEAIKKLTYMPAQRLGFDDRGLIREGAWADIVAFDSETVSEQASLENPGRFSTGIEYVLVNGVAVVENGEPVDNRPGRVLKGDFS